MASKDRERELARAKAYRQSMSRSKRARQRRITQIRVTAAVAAVAVVGGVAFVAFRSGGTEDTLTAQPTASSSPTSAASASAAPAGTCAYPVSPAPVAKDVGVPPTKPTATTGTVDVTLALTGGAVTVALNPAAAPCTVNSFTYLASKGYFDSTPCHRLTTSPTFGVLQCGDPTGNGTGGPGYSFADENLAGATYPAGTVAMANSGANTNGSQFFLVYADTKLGPQYTPFGTITGGLDVLKAIAAQGLAPGSAQPNDGAPKDPVTITSVTPVGG